MIKTEITILVNRKSDIESIKQAIINNKIGFPVYIREYEHHYQIDFTSDYEEWELDSALLECFPEYEFTSELERGRKEIRLQLSRYQSNLSTDGWGRPLESPLNETKYLIKKSNDKPERFNPEITVLFENSEQQYFINIAAGEKGFVLLNEFRTAPTDETEIFQDSLYKNPHEAFNYGYYKMQKLVDNDFKKYLEQKKKEIREQQKIPRKIVRDFINSCNNSDNEGIYKNLDENITYEILNDWQTELKVEGIKEFKKYLEYPNQILCSRNFKIRSSWDIKLPVITIEVKFPVTNDGNETSITQDNRYIRFLFEGDKIVSITVGNYRFI